MSNFLRPHTAATITVAASDKLATYSTGKYTVDKIVGYPNVPSTVASVFAGAGLNTSAAFSAATQVTIAAGEHGLYYETGTGPVITEIGNRSGKSVTVTALNATGALTTAMILGGIVTTTSAAAVAGTLPTGAAFEAVIDADVGDYWDWSVINTGPNTFTVTAGIAGHTLVGVGAAVVTNTSSMFRTVKTAADTFITYCLASAAS